MKDLVMILAMFRLEAGQHHIVMPDSICIQYAVLRTDTLGEAKKMGTQWIISIAVDSEPELVETLVYHEMGHVLGLRYHTGRSLMNYNYLLPLTAAMKKRLFKEIQSNASPAKN